MISGTALRAILSPAGRARRHNRRLAPVRDARERVSEIQLDNVTKRFGRVNAVDGVGFRAQAGKFVVLLGPSGCGKSTLLRLIAGLEEVSEGRVLIAGRDVTALTPDKRRISMVFQSYALFPHLTVEENIVFGLKVRGLGAADRKGRLRKVAEQVGLAEQLERSRNSSPAASASAWRSRARSSPRTRSA